MGQLLTADVESPHCRESKVQKHTMQRLDPQIEYAIAARFLGRWGVDENISLRKRPKVSEEESEQSRT